MKKVFTLFSEVFFWWDSKEILFYNTKFGTYKIVELLPCMLTFCKQMSDMKNMYTISIPADDTSYYCLLKDLQECGFGIIHSVDDDVVSLPPVLNIRNEWSKIKNSKMENHCSILNYLFEVTIFLGGTHSGRQEAYRQTIYPVPSNHILHIDSLSMFVSKLSACSATRINFVFSDISNYTNLSSIIKIISSIGNRACIFIRNTQMSNEAFNMLSKAESATINIIYDTVELDIQHVTASCRQIIIVESTNQYLQWTKILENKGISKFEFVPIYNGNNRQFIVDSLFPSRNELLEGKISKRQIFIHQSVNSFSFGKLYVLPTGEVYSNFQCQSIGSIKDNIHDLIISELNRNYAWRKTRRANGCNGCILVDICPPPSVIEDIIGIGCICHKTE